MKKGLIILLVVTVLFACAAELGNKESIVVCSSMEQFRNDELQRQLSERFPDKNIIVMYMATGKAAAKVYTEGEKTEIDILVGLETGYLNKLSENLADISGLTRIPYSDGLEPADNRNKWVTWEKQAGAIIVNTEILDKYGLEAPTSYEDLLKPEYKGLVAMPDPKSSGTGYFFYKSWVNSMGDEGALKFVDELYPNLKQFTDSGSGPIKLLKQGEIAIGLALTFQAVNEINDGQPFEIIFPEQGSPYSLTGTTVVKGRETNEDVLAVYDFIINEFLVYDKENYSPEEIYEGQKNMIDGYPENITYADMTGIQDDKEKERLLDLWKY
ncbi:MAG: extracellular solute-binding protein [Clostridia bacterium]|nr:extracellular solute-binding protein [Clostridia bacterium]